MQPEEAGGKQKIVNFETSRNLGGLGAILMFVGIFPYISVYGITELLGAILVLIATKGFADYYREAGIFNNALYAIISGIVGAVAFVGIMFVALIDFLTELGISLGVGTISDWTAQVSAIDWQNIAVSTVLKFVGFILLDIVVLFVFFLIAAILLKKSFNLLSTNSGVRLFRTIGTVLLIGAALTIVFGFGLIIVWISSLLVAVAFFQLKPMSPQSPMSANTQSGQV